MRTNTTERRLPVASPFERELGALSDEQTAQVTRILHDFMLDIKALIATGPERNLDCGMCTTCALEPKTFNSRGFAATTFAVAWVLLHQSEFFVCHSNQPNYKRVGVAVSKLEVCRGFVHIIVSGQKRAEVLAETAMCRIAEVVPEARLLEKLKNRPKKPSVVLSALKKAGCTIE